MSIELKAEQPNENVQSDSVKKSKHSKTFEIRTLTKNELFFFSFHSFFVFDFHFNFFFSFSVRYTNTEDSIRYAGFFSLEYRRRSSSQNANYILHVRLVHINFLFVKDDLRILHSQNQWQPIYQQCGNSYGKVSLLVAFGLSSGLPLSHHTFPPSYSFFLSSAWHFSLCSLSVAGLCVSFHLHCCSGIRANMFNAMIF